MSRYYDDFLMHHGRKGQKWGVENGPPYPLNATGLAKFRKKLKEYKDGAEDRKRAKAVKKADKAQAKAERTQAKREERLDKLSRSPTYLWKHKDAYTTEELNQALNRINTEQRIHEASMKEIKRGKDICDAIIGYGKTVNDAYKTFNNMSKNFKDLKDGKFGKESIDDDDKKKKKNTDDDDVEVINDDDVTVEPNKPRPSLAEKAYWAYTNGRRRRR